VFFPPASGGSNEPEGSEDDALENKDQQQKSEIHGSVFKHVFLQFCSGIDFKDKDQVVGYSNVLLLTDRLPLKFSRLPEFFNGTFKKRLPHKWMYSP